MAVKIQDLKVGQKVKLYSDCCPIGGNNQKEEDRIGEIVSLPSENLYNHNDMILIRIKGGWENSPLVNISPNSDLVYQRLRANNSYGGWLVSTWDIESIVSEEIVEPKSFGGYCRICNEFNQYQSGLFDCYRCTH